MNLLYSVRLFLFRLYLFIFRQWAWLRVPPLYMMIEDNIMNADLMQPYLICTLSKWLPVFQYFLYDNDRYEDFTI